MLAETGITSSNPVYSIDISLHISAVPYGAGFLAVTAFSIDGPYHMS
jgi:hypothetical protein